LVNAIGNTKMAANATRSDPTSPAENDTNPFFIKMNEVPQMRASIINKIIDVKFFVSVMVSRPANIENPQQIQIQKLAIKY